MSDDEYDGVTIKMMINDEIIKEQQYTAVKILSESMVSMGCEQMIQDMAVEAFRDLMYKYKYGTGDDDE